MSDFEKNENETAQDTAAQEEILTAETDDGEAVENADEKEALEEELEDIKTKFQELLDEAAETYLAGGDIQDYEEDSSQKADEEELNEDEICQCCGEKKRDTSYGDSYPYCSECRELMQHYPLSFKGILALICVLVITGLSIFFVFGSNTELIDNALTADTYYKDGKIYSALETYGQLMQSYASNSDSLTSAVMPKKVAARYAQAYASLVNYNYANAVVQNFFTESDLKNPAYRSLKEYGKKYECYSKIIELINGALEGENAKADEICASLEALKEEEDGDAFLVDYYKYIITQYLGETPEKQYEMLEGLIKDYPSKWPLKYELCAIASKLGKADVAQSCLDEVVKYNSEDGAIYAYLADAYRFSEEYDADKILEIVEKGFEADGDSGYSTADLNRVKAVAYILKGDSATAYEAASQSYQLAISSLNYGYTVNNTEQIMYIYQLCAYLEKNTEAFDEVNTYLGYLGIEESKDIQSYINGERTLEDILTDGEGDFS